MINKYLSVAALLLTLNGAYAQTDVTLAYATPAKTMASSSDHSEYTAENTAVLPKRTVWGSDGRSRVHLFESASLGYASASTNAPGTSIGGGFLYGVEFGAQFKLPTRGEINKNLLSASLALTGYSIKQKYKDSKGVSISDKYKFAFVSLPISFMMIRSTGSGRLPMFFAQGGASIHYMVDAKFGDKKKVAEQFNRTLIEPFICTGFGVRYRLLGSSDGREGVMLMGPFAGYSVTSMSKTSSISLNTYTIGMRWIIVGEI